MAMAAAAALPTTDEDIACIARPVTLPCGLTLPNRLVKAAMEEMLPLHLQEALYEVWAEGGWGMIITGNVQVSPAHLGTPLDLAIPPRPVPASFLDSCARWARASRPRSSSASASAAGAGGGPPITLVQLNHPGRQSMRFLCGRPPWFPSLAPSAVPLQVAGRLLGRLLWGSPRAMTTQDLDEVVEAFVNGARVAHAAGWDGVQLHASHGYLLASFLSPRVNLRTDAYGGTTAKRLILLFRIIEGIRAEYPQRTGFCVGVKLNCSDFVKGGVTEQDALDHIRQIVEHGGVDFIEISGGSYEHPEFMNTATNSPPSPKKASTIAREAFFARFAQQAQGVLARLPPDSLPSPPPLLLLTGGLRTRGGMARCLSATAETAEAGGGPTADLVGLARPAAADPFLPHTLLSPDVPAAAAHAPVYDPLYGVRWLRALFGGVALVGPGLDVVYHTLLLRQIALQRWRRRRRPREAEEEERNQDSGGLVRYWGSEESSLDGFWYLLWRTWGPPVWPRWVVGGATATAAGVLMSVFGRKIVGGGIE